MSKIIASVNNKGGMCKSTSTQHIGLTLARQGFRVLLIDLDSQANLTSAFTGAEEHGQTGNHVGEWLLGNKPFEDVIFCVNDCLFIMPSMKKVLDEFEERMFAKMSRDMILKRALAPHRKNFDFILIDTPPKLGVMTTNALYAADSYYVPMVPTKYGYDGIDTVIQFANQVRLDNSDLRYIGMAIMMHNPNQRNMMRKIFTEAVMGNSDLKAFHTIIRQDSTVEKCLQLQTSVYDFAPDSNLARDYTSLTAEILERYDRQ